MSTPPTLIEPSRRTPVYGEFDVVVVGGGPSGLMAAAAAARAGRSTLLLERYGFLGGAGTAGGLSTFCGLHAKVHGEHRRVIHGLADELLDRLSKLDGDAITADTLAGDPITAKLSKAPGNDAAVGGVKVVTDKAWFAARPSGTEDVYKIYAESFVGQEHLEQVQREAKEIVDAALGA